MMSLETFKDCKTMQRMQQLHMVKLLKLEIAQQHLVRDKVSEQMGTKLRGDETFGELMSKLGKPNRPGPRFTIP